MKRNLIYFICPFKETEEEWIMNLQMIKRYQDVFNNKRIFAIASGDGLAPPGYVVDRIKEIGITDFEHIVTPNDKKLGEVLPFMEMLQRVKSTDKNEATFYAHAKGVKPVYSTDDYTAVLHNIRMWRNIMYYFALNDINLIDSVLKSHACAGSYFKYQGLPVGWGFAGTFFWFNHSSVFTSRNWDMVRYHRCGVEGYLGELIPKSQSYQLFGAGFERKCLYSLGPDETEPELVKHGIDVEYIMNLSNKESNIENG